MQKVTLKLFPTENLRTSVNKYTLNKFLLKISFNRNSFQKFYHILFCTIGSFALVERKKSPYAMINLWLRSFKEQLRLDNACKVSVIKFAPLAIVTIANIEIIKYTAVLSKLKTIT